MALFDEWLITPNGLVSQLVKATHLVVRGKCLLLKNSITFFGHEISNDGVKDISGYFIAPMTGEFKFYTSCSHPCEVYLSPDTEGEHRSRIISQHHKSGPKSFERFVLMYISKVTTIGIIDIIRYIKLEKYSIDGK